ncbi:MAG: hypothetical protein EBS49_09465 [Verrucomicrobia bacterium]|nr:hypothetical protein [Verrucomicrobiota bacterium]
MELTRAQRLSYVLISFVTFQKSYYVRMIQRKKLNAKLNLQLFLERGSQRLQTLNIFARFGKIIQKKSAC